MEVDPSDLFARYAVRVHQYFKRMTGGVDDAADLTQEVFLRIVRGSPRYESRGREAAWVFRIARSVLATRHRSANKLDEIPLSDAEVLSEPNHVLAIGFDEALRLLPKTDRDVYLLREQGGLAYDEIAELCRLTTDSVRAHLYRARAEVRRLLAARLSSELQE
jgi:RNA polymerase sigma-70 factor (ECF subfamily)